MAPIETTKSLIDITAMLRISKFLFILFIFGCGAELEMSKSPVVFEAIYDSGTASSNLLFKQDSTFEWFSGSALGATETYQGKYIQRDSVIELNKMGFSRVVKSNRLLLTSVHPHSGRGSGSSLVQVDSLNKVVDSIFIFIVRKF